MSVRVSQLKLNKIRISSQPELIVPLGLLDQPGQGLVSVSQLVDVVRDLKTKIKFNIDECGKFQCTGKLLGNKLLNLL